MKINRVFLGKKIVHNGSELVLSNDLDQKVLKEILNNGGSHYLELDESERPAPKAEKKPKVEKKPKAAKKTAAKKATADNGGDSDPGSEAEKTGPGKVADNSSENVES